jgi:NADH-quinone oxidoreductase subunit J
METLVGVLAGVGALVGAAVAVSHRNAVIGALFLVLNLLSIAVLYVLLEAPFVAAIQVIVYAGAIMVLFLFIIMLLDLRHEEGSESGWLQRALATAAGALLLVFLARGIMGAAAPAAAAGKAGGVAELAAVLFTRYLVPFEVISVLLLVALVGAVVLARRGGAA